ncbi:YdeI/OmpD-associated family protein [Neorhizobium sp. NPDC001467]|uniref:YdeI/OmpD-associated family protein n=1 Tax=Neorhizobium sp. NPDC001467 TaxID=3390595 RepID=UPI003D0552E9
MVKAATNPDVDAYFERQTHWREELEVLREIVLECGLVEQLKWGEPCYTVEGANAIIIHGFNDYCALLFFKGVLMKDPQNILIQQTKNVQATRQIRFTQAVEIARMRDVLIAYVQEAVTVEKAGLKVAYRKTEEFPVPQEFQARLEAAPELKTAFEALTPGRQRAYLLNFAAPKQSKTRQARIDKAVPRILEGKGLND